jgi:hypothetical protein
VIAMSALLLIAMFTFMAIGVDTGRIVATQTQMQNACDAAALAASGELTGTFRASGGSGGIEVDAEADAVERARQVAAQVAAENGVYVDPQEDIRFGHRTFNASNGGWPITWDEAPYNVVQVIARRTDDDTSAQDGRLPLAFGWAVGQPSASLTTSATAFVEARDMVLVLDFSASMNDDSCIRSVPRLGLSQVNGMLDAMWSSLRTADPKWQGTSISKFPANGFGGINSANGTTVSSLSVSTVIDQLGLDQTVNGKPKYPFPQAGTYSNGTPKPMPTASQSENMWRDYVEYVIDNSRRYSSWNNHKYKFGYRTLMDYLQESQYDASDSEDLWRTPHYPFNAVKEGATLLTEFLEELDYGDELGLVSYATRSQKEMTLSSDGYSIDLSSDPITDDYDAINQIQRHKQAGHYSPNTGMGFGIDDARDMLVGDPNNSSNNGHSRYGAKPIMIVMTDGQNNQYPSGWSLPGSFKWKDWTDYDGDGDADYSTNDRAKQHAFYEATVAIKQGVTVHSISVGAYADNELMFAIAFAGKGVYLNVPGGTSISEMESEMLDAFEHIASNVPPPKLIYNPDAFNQ